MLAKRKLIRLKGKAYERLKWEVYRRDKESCVSCGKHVPTIMGSNYIEHPPHPHHEPCGRYKEDVKEKMGTTCDYCHERRESKDGEAIKEKFVNYLDELYPYRRDMFEIPPKKESPEGLNKSTVLV